jgi:hypothetical protein
MCSRMPRRWTVTPRTGRGTLFARAVERAGIRTGDVTLQRLRRTALGRMIEKAYDDYTVMAIRGHSSTIMLVRYTHPTEERKAEPLGSFSHSGVTMASRSPDAPSDELAELKDLLEKVGGRQEARTPDLRVANERWERPYLVKRSRRKRRKPAE